MGRKNIKDSFIKNNIKPYPLYTFFRFLPKIFEFIKQVTKFIQKCNNPDFQLKIGKEILSVDPAYFRPNEVDLLIGDSTKVKEKLGWYQNMIWHRW